MALLLFSCRATGPFIMFEETARRIFEVIDQPWMEEGAFPVEDLPQILSLLEAASQQDKEHLAEIRAAREKKLREATYDEELKMLEEEKKRGAEKVHFYQRIAPLQDMIRRAIKHGDPVVWGRP
ncbi:MAG: DUF1840 domain-containing protein [Sutterella wadsworthensis]|nr:DUF1840 domain-containing protein [Sutterella wadsworthensis]